LVQHSVAEAKGIHFHVAERGDPGGPRRARLGDRPGTRLGPDL